MNRLSALMLVGIACLVMVPAAAQPTVGTGQAAVLTSNDLYRGRLASEILGKEVVSRADVRLGLVRNVLIDDNGHAKALLIEADGSGAGKEFLFRIPWEDASFSSQPERIVIDISDARDPQFGLFRDDGRGQLPPEFPVSALIGDYARLQTGHAYGYVRDVVFQPQGRIVAVLVARDVRAGGGTIAFAFPKEPAHSWNPHASYYGLPHVTAQQAEAAAIRVDLDRFQKWKTNAG